MDWTARVRSAFDGAANAPDVDVIEELAQHARAAYEAARADGLSHEDANRRIVDLIRRWQRNAAALRRPQRPPAVEPPPVTSSSRFAGIGHDLRYAARLLVRQRRASALVILTMALGIGVTTVLFRCHVRRPDAPAAVAARRSNRHGEGDARRTAAAVRRADERRLPDLARRGAHDRRPRRMVASRGDVRR